MSANVSHNFHPLPGGIHPPENKQQSLQEPIRQAALPARVIIPLTQPGFAPPHVKVREGDRVLKGQVLATGNPSMGLNAHASTSGTVTAITEHAVPNMSGIAELCAIIESDGRDEWDKLPPLDPELVDADTLISRIHDCGVSGLGGAGFPAHTKLRGARIKIHTLVINAAECEPFITADHALMRELADEIIAGIRLLLKISGATRCLIGIEDNKPDARDAMLKAMDDAFDDRIELIEVPTKYPSGAEKQLIWLLTGTEVPTGKITIQSGIMCQNVGTARAIYRAVVHGEALVSRITTLTGAALNRPGNLEVLIGTPVADLLAQCEIDHHRLSRLISGGPLMGFHLPHADLPIVKITNCIIATTDAELPAPSPQQACIRCGFCSEVCPVSLLPQQLYWFSRSKELEKAQQHNIMDCIECGACAYVCPSHIPLVQYYRATKAEIREAKEKERKAEYSKQRFDFHQERLEEQKRQDEQRRAERAALAKKRKEEAANADQTEAKDAIKAALERVNAKKAARAKAAAEDSDKGAQS
jgi:electron transport complex protein RnfC